jgi:hypothetical protein
MKPTLKPPGTKRLKLECDMLLSSSAFEFNLRRYTMVQQERLMFAQARASTPKAGPCRLTLSNPH